MTVQAGFSDDLWRWLLKQGWRELRYRPDRRHYHSVPSTCVSELIDGAAEKRRLVLAFAVEIASPIIGDPNATPSGVTRR